jgi:hypothetical protein
MQWALIEVRGLSSFSSPPELGPLALCRLARGEVVSSIFALHATFKPLAAIPPPHDCADQPGPDFPNFGELRMRGMRPRILHEPGEVWVRDKYAERIEDDGCSVLSGALRVDQLAELIELEVGGNDTADLPMQRYAQGDHRCANAE